MSGLVNWDQDLSPFYTHNQPPLFFYALAGWGNIFGFSELSFHLLMAIFSFFCLFLFLQILIKIRAKSQVTLLLFFGFNVGFIVNQNVMVDVPLLMVILGFSYFLISEKNANYFVATLFLTAGLFIKYTILPLMVVYVLITFVHKKKEKLLYLIIPIFFLLVWSVWNYNEFQGFHISSRSGFSLTLNSIYSYISTLGAVSFFAILFVYFFHGTIFKFLFYLVLASVLVLPVMAFFELFSIQLLNAFVKYGFLVLGLTILFMVFKMFYHDYRNYVTNKIYCSSRFLIYIVIGGLGLFILGWAPFYATRHLLLLIPFILLLLDPYVTRMPLLSRYAVLFVFIVVNLIISFSDVRFSNYYRVMANEISIKDSVKVWTAGHWGWQYYSINHGMSQYHRSSSRPKEGDLFVFPSIVPRQDLNPDYDLEILEKRWKEPNFIDFFHVNGKGNLYASKHNYPAISFSRQPIDTIVIARILTRNRE